jgi:hypothetical protein
VLNVVCNVLGTVVKQLRKATELYDRPSVTSRPPFGGFFVKFDAGDFY